MCRGEGGACDIKQPVPGASDQCSAALQPTERDAEPTRLLRVQDSETRSGSYIQQGHGELKEDGTVALWWGRPCSDRVMVHVIFLKLSLSITIKI